MFNMLGVLGPSKARDCQKPTRPIEQGKEEGMIFRQYFWADEEAPNWQILEP